MFQILLTPVAVGYLADLMLLAYVAVILGRAKRSEASSEAAHWLFRSVGWAAGFAACSLLGKAIPTSTGILFRYCENLPLSVCGYCLVRFAYAFPSPIPRLAGEARTAARVAALAPVFEAGLLAYRFHELATRHHVVWRPLWSELILPGVFLLAVVGLLSQAVQSADPGDRRPAWARLFQPRSRGARGAGGMAGVTLLCLGVALLSPLRPASLSEALTDSLESIGTLAAIYLFTVRFIQFFPGSVSIQFRLVGLALVSFFAVQSAAQWLVTEVESAHHLTNLKAQRLELRPYMATPQSLVFKPLVGSTGYLLQATPGDHLEEPPSPLAKGALFEGDFMTIPLGFVFPFFDGQATNLVISKNGYLGVGAEAPQFADFRWRFGSSPAIVPALAELSFPPEVGGGIGIESSADRLTITWMQMAVVGRGTQRATFQVVLFPSGEIRFHYRALGPAGAPVAKLAGLISGKGLPTVASFADGRTPGAATLPAEGMVQDVDVEMRRGVHPFSLRMAEITVGAGILIMALFPWALRGALVVPIRRLLAGIRAFDPDRPTAPLPEDRNDELGFLTASFNRMAASIWNTSAELRRHRDNLEQLVRNRTSALEAEVLQRERIASELERAREAAEAADRAKSEFLANMSHEIRTPMNGVLGMMHLLLETPLNREQREFASTAYKSAEGLLTVINDILDFSKIEAGKLELEKADFDLGECVEGAVDLVAGSAHEKGLELILDFPESVPRALHGDSGRLRQVLINLLGNAVKFTEQGEITVTVTGREQPDGQIDLRVAVRDTGVGVPHDRQARLFQPFSQADTSTARRFGGTGLGLIICRRLVELMGGRIGFVSEPGKGSTFHFTLSLAQQAGRRSRVRARPAPPRLKGRRVLLAYGNATNRRLLEGHLRRQGAEVVSVGSAAEAGAALAEAARNPFGVALLDQDLPGGEGLGVAQRIANDPAFAGTRVVLAASMSDRLRLTEASKDTVAAWLVKPPKPASIRRCFDELLGGSPAARLLEAETPASSGDSSSSVRILLAEDNMVNQTVALTYLQRLGYTAEAVGTGEAAVEAAARETFDVIFMDCQLPVLDGIEATHRIRSSEPPNRRALIIAMTARASTEDREACLAAGMDDYITKPVRSDVLRACLERHLGARPVPETGPSGDEPVAAAPPGAA